MGRSTTVAVAAFLLAAMMAASPPAHAGGRAPRETTAPPHAGLRSSIGALLSRLSGVSFLTLGHGVLPPEAAGPAAAGPENVAFVIGKIGGRDVNYYEKNPIYAP
ncbi:hypothetical protein ACP4OV_021373 [Aristida adscensionis]